MSDIVVDSDPYFSPICNSCIHLNVGTLSCKAFKKIPDEILDGDNNHSKPLTDQGNDIVFTPKNKKNVLSRV